MDDVKRDRRADRILARLLELAPEAQPAALIEACGDDDALAVRVRQLLELTKGSDEALQTGAPLRSELGRDAFRKDVLGETVGPYRIVRELGRGGSATVYLGERADDTFDQRVAIKILDASDDAAGVVSRFARERRILAGIAHPHIAGLLDGGTTAWGHPYVVVEYVEGTTITRYCDSRGLGIRDRLALFLDAADAVEYAHRRLIVHRDLKPSNILVTVEGELKLLDFGIAKLLDPAPSDAAVTRTATLWLTPSYASPEQLLGETITTAADVYQLGLLLYELLAGQPAYDSRDLTPAGLVAAAEARASLQPDGVPGELAAIVSVATRPESERRYTSVALLAADVRAFLDNRPVRARGDSMGYRVGKWLARNRLAGVSVALSLLAMIAFAVGITIGFVRAERQRDRAEAFGTFLEDTLRGAQPHIALGRDTALLEAIVDDAAARVDRELADQPEARDEIRLTLAQTYRSLSRYEDAHAHARSAAESVERRLGPDAGPTLYARNLLGLTFWDLGRFDEAEQVLADALPRARDVLDRSDSTLLDLITNLGLVVRAQGRLSDAEPLYREAMDLSRDTGGAEHPRTISTMSNLSFLLMELDQADEAERLARQAAELGRANLGPDDSDTWLYVDKLASLIGDRGRPDEALPLHLEAFEGMQRTLGPRHSTTLGSAYNLARVQRGLERHEDALATLDAMLPILDEKFGVESRYALFTRFERGLVLLATGRVDAALRILVDAERLAREILEPDHYQHGIIRLNLAEAYIRAGRSDRARPLLVDARRLLEAAFGEDGTHRHFEALTRVEAML